MDRRQRPRYPLRMRMSVLRVNGEEANIPAYTCNVSRSGVLFQCSERLSVGQSIVYVIDLYPERSVQLRCCGHVVRWAASGPLRDQSNLFAATIEAYDCVRYASPVKSGAVEPQYVFR